MPALRKTTTTPIAPAKKRKRDPNPTLGEILGYSKPKPARNAEFSIMIDKSNRLGNGAHLTIRRNIERDLIDREFKILGTGMDVHHGPKASMDITMSTRRVRDSSTIKLIESIVKHQLLPTMLSDSNVRIERIMR